MTRSRVLIVGESGTGKLSLLKLPTVIDDSSHAGLTHPYRIETKYYSASADLWVDELSEKSETANSAVWAEAFTAEPAKEVRDVIAAFIFTFDPKALHWQDQLKQMGKFVEKLNDEGWDGVVVAASKGGLDERAELDAEDLFFDLGFEYINLEDPVEGYKRVEAALASHEWETMDEPGGDNDAGAAGGEDDGDAPQMSEEEVKATINQLQMTKGLLDKHNRSMEGEVENLDTFMEKLKRVRDDDTLTNDDRKALSEVLADELLDLI